MLNQLIMEPDNSTDKKNSESSSEMREFTFRNYRKPNQEKVKEFTQASFDCPGKPQAMNRTEAEFLAGMVISEVAELLQTVIPNNSEVVDTMKSLCDKDLSEHPGLKENREEVIADQADAMVDWMYYTYNTAAKKGVDLDRVFEIVHDANMLKRFPDGEFHKRDDGKIIKPGGWREPDIVGEIRKQME